MGIKTVPHHAYSPDLAPWDFWLFPKLIGCHYERIEEIKEAVTKVIDTLTEEDFHGAFQKLLEQYKCIAAGGDYFEGDLGFMCVLSITVPIREKSGNLFNDPRKSQAGITTPGQSEPGCNGNEEVLHTLQISRTGTLPSDTVYYTQKNVLQAD